MTLERWLPRNRQAFALVSLSLAVLPLAAVTTTITRLHKNHLSTLAAD